MRGRYFTLPFLLALLSTGCDEQISRTVTLRFEPGVPHAESVVVGDTLRIHVEHLEPFREGKELTAWAHVDPAPARLGAVDLHEPTAFVGTALGLNWAEVEEIVLTQESAAPAPTTPSATVHFRGLPGGPLESAMTEAPLAAAAVRAEIEDRTLRLEYGELPFPGAGRFYGVWVFGESDHDEPAERLFLGALSLTDEDTFSGEEILATHHEVVVTVELESGVEAPALESVVFRGEIPKELEATEEEGEEPPGHGH